jgi:hypothetical protein
MANKHRKVWKVVSRKVNSGKQAWPKLRNFSLYPAISLANNWKQKSGEQKKRRKAKILCESAVYTSLKLQ